MTCHNRRANACTGNCVSSQKGAYSHAPCSSCGSPSTSCHSGCSPGSGRHTSCKPNHGCRSTCSHGGCRSSCAHGKPSTSSNTPYKPNACTTPGCIHDQRCGNCGQCRRGGCGVYITLAILTGGVSCGVYPIVRAVRRRVANKGMSQGQGRGQGQQRMGRNGEGDVEGEAFGRCGYEGAVDKPVDPPAYADVAGGVDTAGAGGKEKVGF